MIANEEDSFKLQKTRYLHNYVQDRLAPNTRFPAEKMAQVEENFKLFHSNGDGKKSRSELLEALEKQGAKPCDSDLDPIWREVDKDESASIDLEEFVTLMADNFEFTYDELMDALLADGNGTLCEEEIMTLMRNLGMWLMESWLATRKMNNMCDFFLHTIDKILY
jgi:Ca2+-binding EF-hand superfamily protein